jgi:putative copper export protein/mono/diheme cytochrome c family protein
VNSLLVVTRLLHFAAALLLFGGLILRLVVLDPAARISPPAAGQANERVRAFLQVAAWWGLAVSLFSGVAWLFLEAALMSGQPISEVTHGDAVWLVLNGTGFGRLWMWRLGIAAALCALMVAQTATARGRRSPKGAWLALALAGAYLASLALVGHAADGRGAERIQRITTDVVHLLAAGAWLGALPGLAVLLASARLTPSAASLRLAARAARRFSRLGIVSVGALILSGLGNAWYLVGDIPALLGTSYGQLLVTKILLFATMVALAATNRWRLTPRLEDRDGLALRLLARNAALEIVAGVAVVAIVGALGVAIPAAHQSPVWPLDFALSLAPIKESVSSRWILGVCLATLCVVVFVLASGRGRSERIGPRTNAMFGGMGAVAIVVGVGVLAGPAHPTSFAHPPVKYTTLAIARGGASYDVNCAQCHGLDGRGDGPSAAALPIRPADLAAHALHHRSGDLFWWIAHGIPDTPMPAFSPRLGDEELWGLVQYLRALSESRAARALTNDVAPFRPIAAPDFSFQESPRTQRTLSQLRGHEVLLVLGVLPQSLQRLRQIEAQRNQLAQAGIRAVTMVRRDGTAAESSEAVPGMLRLAVVDSETTEAYAMFSCQGAIPCKSSASSPHVELLVDRAGYLRARWLGVAAPGGDRTAEIVARAHQLQQEPPRAPAQQEHRH